MCHFYLQHLNDFKNCLTNILMPKSLENIYRKMQFVNSLATLSKRSIVVSHSTDHRKT